MASVVKNPFFIAIAAAVLIGAAFGLLFTSTVKDVGTIFVVAGTFMLFALVPTMLVTFIVAGALKYNTKLKAEQARVPKAVLSNRYMDQMLWSLVATIIGVVITAVTYMLAQGAGGGTYVICTGAIVFGLLSFLQGLVGWLRNL